MRVLVGFETSGMVRRAFEAKGHDAWSIDILPSEDACPKHIEGDIFEYLSDPFVTDQFDLAIFHPPCTYLTNSAAWAFKDGPYHQKVKPGTLVGAERRMARVLAAEDFMTLTRCGIPKIAIENPIGFMSGAYRKPDQIIQPYEFGDDASKATCLWLIGLEPLVVDPAMRVRGRQVVQNGKVVERWGNQTDSGQNRLSPSEDRWSKRSKTYPGIANAMALNWG